MAEEEFLDEQKEYERRREIIADGSKTEFWDVMSTMLYDLSSDAVEALKTADPGNIGRIAELQQVNKVCEMICSIVHSFAEEQAAVDKNKKDKFKEVLSEPAR